MEVSGQLHVPAALPPGKGPRYTLDRKLSGSQSQSDAVAYEKNTSFCRETNTLRQASSLVTILTELPRFIHVFISNNFKGEGIPVLLTEHHAMKTY
jgi:hypothetical protein